jgi:hypothetical protein
VDDTNEGFETRLRGCVAFTWLLAAPKNLSRRLFSKHFKIRKKKKLHITFTVISKIKKNW